jgi:hypothetical protein
LGDDVKAAAMQEKFMRTVVVNFQNVWEMTSADIDHVLSAL